MRQKTCILTKEPLNNEVIIFTTLIYQLPEVSVSNLLDDLKPWTENRFYVLPLELYVFRTSSEYRSSA